MNIIQSKLNTFNNRISKPLAAGVLTMQNADNNKNADVINPTKSVEEFEEKIIKAIENQQDVEKVKILNVKEFEYGYLLEIKIAYVQDGEDYEAMYELLYASIW